MSHLAKITTLNENAWNKLRAKRGLGGSEEHSILNADSIVTGEDVLKDSEYAKDFVMLECKAPLGLRAVINLIARESLDEAAVKLIKLHGDLIIPKLAAERYVWESYRKEGKLETEYPSGEGMSGYSWDIALKTKELLGLEVGDSESYFISFLDGIYDSIDKVAGERIAHYKEFSITDENVSDIISEHLELDILNTNTFQLK